MNFFRVAHLRQVNLLAGTSNSYDQVSARVSILHPAILTPHDEHRSNNDLLTRKPHSNKHEHIAALVLKFDRNGVTVNAC